MSSERSAYEVKLTKAAAAQLATVVRGMNPSERARLQQALAQLQSNPFPTAPLPTGTVKKISDFWRYKISRSYRMAYRVDGKRVVIFKIGDRKDFYRDL